MSVTDGARPAAAEADRPRREPGGGSSPGAPVALPSSCRVGIAAVVVAGVLLRFWCDSALWLDEALSVNIASLPLGDIPDALRQDGHPPLYYALLHLWIDVAGDGDGAVRALSGLLSVAALPFAWLLGHRIGGRSVAWLTLVLFALNPFLLRYATETRMYSLVVLLVLLGALALHRAVEQPTVARLWPLPLLAGALLLTHYWALYLVAATLILLVLWGWRPARRRDATRVAVAVALGGLAFVPWLGVFLDQLRHTGTPWASPMRPTRALAITMNDLGGTAWEGQLAGTALVLLAAFALFGRADGRWRVVLDLRTVPGARAVLAVAGLTLALGLTAMFVAGGTFETRYASVFYPFVLAASALGLMRFGDLALRHALLVALVLAGLLGGYRAATVERSQLGPIVEMLNAQAAPGDLVAYCPDQLGPAGSRHLRDDVETVVYPTMGPPDRVDWRDYEDRQAAADPQAFAAALLERAGPDASVWLAWAGTYRTFEDHCETLHAALMAARPGVAVVDDDGTTYFEHAWLFRYPAP